MYPIPEYFKVDPQYLFGINENEFIDGFRCLWNTVRDMYKDIVESPEVWGLPCVEDFNPSSGKYKFDQKRAESGNSSRRLMEFLKMICQIGDLQGNKLIIPFAVYEEHLKKIKPKVTNAASCMLITRLVNFGFGFMGFDGKSFDKNSDSFEVSYEDNKNLIPALYGYSMNIPVRWEKLSVCHYDSVAVIDTIPQPVCAFVFSQYFTGNQKKFFIKFNERLLEEGFVCIDSGGYPFVVEYYTSRQIPLNKDKPFIVRCLSDNNQLTIIMKMTDIANYSEYVNTLPSRIKSCYKVSHCRYCVKNCEAHYKWTIDGETFKDCQWGDGAHVTDFTLDDVKTYISIIKMEAGNKRYR